MIFPVRCFSCGKPIGHLWSKYKEEVANGKNPKDVLDKLEIERYCCRTIFLTHTDILKDISKFKI